MYMCFTIIRFLWRRPGEMRGNKTVYSCGRNVAECNGRAEKGNRKEMIEHVSENCRASVQKRKKPRGISNRSSLMREKTNYDEHCGTEINVQR